MPNANFQHTAASHFMKYLQFLRWQAQKRFLLLLLDIKKSLTSIAVSPFFFRSPTTLGSLLLSPDHVEFCFSREHRAGSKVSSSLHVLLQTAPANYNITPVHYWPRLHAHESLTTYTGDTTSGWGAEASAKLLLLLQIQLKRVLIV